MIGGWLGGYGKVRTTRLTFLIGSAIWVVGFVGNLHHDAILRQIRAKNENAHVSQALEEKESAHVRIVDGRVYKVPRGGLFEYVLFPHVILTLKPPCNLLLCVYGTS